VSRMGYVLPSLLLGNSLVTISYGLFSTFRPMTSTGQWIGYQILAGSGRGMSIQMVSTLFCLLMIYCTNAHVL
jgi:hypothetical protein